MIKRHVLLLLAVGVGAAFVTAPASASEQSITIDNFTFRPATVTVHAGTSVTFENVDDIPHSVVMVDGSFHSKALDTDDKVSVVFDKVGDFAYFCGIHPHMQGKITVVP